MPALKDKALTLLGSAALSIQTGGALTIFTTPIGKVTRITHIVARDPSGSCAGATDIRFGTAFRNNAAAGVDLSSMTTANTDYMVLDNHTKAGADVKNTELAAGTAFQMTPSTGTAGAVTVTFDVFGYTT